MVLASFTLKEEYWQNFEVEAEDIEFLYNHLLELETPLPPRDLASVLIKDRKV